MNLEEPDEYNRRIALFLREVERGGWGPRDPRANPARPLFMGDKPGAA